MTRAILFGETTLGDYAGVNGSGWLVSVEFLVIGYGDTTLNISPSAQPAKTRQLDHMLRDITFRTENGYFSNKILGDTDGDRDVDPDDFYIFSGNY